jgi:hypothetical protein
MINCCCPALWAYKEGKKPGITLFVGTTLEMEGLGGETPGGNG